MALDKKAEQGSPLWERCTKKSIVESLYKEANCGEIHSRAGKSRRRRRRCRPCRRRRTLSQLTSMYCSLTIGFPVRRPHNGLLCTAPLQWTSLYCDLTVDFFEGKAITLNTLCWKAVFYCGFCVFSCF